ncbi:MAG TPA: glycosyltransferase family 1 protein, partial [Elusimicrobiales bacterium]|nr:glycosyltransferase family 1 protein [Elusimicrobiales bacterium]
RYAREVTRALDELAEGNEVRLLVPRSVCAADIVLRNIQIERAGVLDGHLWEQTELPFYSRKGVLLNLCNPAPLFRSRQVSLMHDVIVFAVPDSTSFLFRAWHRTIFRSVSALTRLIVTDSEFSRGEIVKYLGTSPDKIKVVYAGCDHIGRIDRDDTVLSRHGLSSRPFIFAVSSLNPNKNFASIVRAFESLGRPDFDLVIAGGVNPAVFSRSKADFPPHVRYLGYVTDGELKSLYSAASCFIYPSFYEGFGLPPLEAMASGAPVIVSRASSLPEVCGDAARYIDPRSADSIAAAIKEVMGDSALRARLRTKGLERARAFTWESTARLLYRICLEASA